MTNREIHRRFAIAYAMTLVTNISVSISIAHTLGDNLSSTFLMLVSVIYHVTLLLRFEKNLTDAKGEKC